MLLRSANELNLRWHPSLFLGRKGLAEKLSIGDSHCYGRHLYRHCKLAKELSLNIALQSLLSSPSVL